MKIKPLAFLSLGHMAVDFYPGMLSPLLPVFIERHGWSITQTGILVTVLQLSANLSQPVFGIINDRRPLKSLIWIGLLLSAIPFSFALNIHRLDIMIAAMAVCGIGVGSFHPVAVVAAGCAADEQRKGLSMALFSSGGHISVMLAPLAAVLIVEVLGDAYMPVILLPALFVALCFALDRKLVYNEGHGYTLRQWFSSLYESGRELLLFWFISSFRAIVMMLVGSFLPMYAMARGFSYADSAYFLSASLFAGLVGMIIGGHLSDIHGRKNIIALTMFLSVPLLYGFLLTSGAVSVILLLLGMGLLSSAIPVTIILAQHAAPGHAGMASSLVMGMSFAMGALAATPFGALADRVGIETAMYVPMILPALGGISVFFVRNE